MEPISVTGVRFLINRTIWVHMTRTTNTSRIEAEIDRNLRRAYDDVVNEDVPDRFTQLLNELRAKETSADDGGGHPS